MTIGGLSIVNGNGGTNLGIGGGIANDGTLTVSNCTFANNTAGYAAGATLAAASIDTHRDDLTVSNSTFSSNSASRMRRRHLQPRRDANGQQQHLRQQHLPATAAASSSDSSYNRGIADGQQQHHRQQHRRYGGGGIFNLRHADGQQQHHRQQHRTNFNTGGGISTLGGHGDGFSTPSSPAIRAQTLVPISLALSFPRATI